MCITACEFSSDFLLFSFLSFCSLFILINVFHILFWIFSHYKIWILLIIFLFISQCYLFMYMSPTVSECSELTSVSLSSAWRVHENKVASIAVGKCVWVTIRNAHLLCPTRNFSELFWSFRYKRCSFFSTLWLSKLLTWIVGMCMLMPYMSFKPRSVWICSSCVSWESPCIIGCNKAASRL